MNPSNNPYAPSAIPEPISRRIKIRPLQLLRRSFEMIRGDYWLFLGITLVAMLIGSLVPFGILLGPMMVGIFLCFQQRQQTGRTEFATAMKGFDQFMDALIATLVMIAFSMVVLIPIMIIFIVWMIFMISPSMQPPAPGAAPPAPSPIALASIFAIYPLIILANLAVYIPFLFVYQLIADRRLTGMEAVKASASASWQNLGGVTLFLIILFLTAFLAMIPCFVPAILLMPILIGATWILYQDIFGIAQPPQPAPQA